MTFGMTAGEFNLVTDVAGLRVGNAHDERLRSGVTVLTAERPFVAAAHVMGGAPGTRETDLLAPDRLVQQADAIVLAGGSALGLDAASGVADALREGGRGFAVGDQVVPIVPAAILFDLANGGDKGWRENPYRALGREALTDAGRRFALGSVGAGHGATTMDLRGGLGSASCVLGSGVTVGALVVLNALGRVCDDGGRFHAAMHEIDGEFGDRGPARPDPRWEPAQGRMKGEATTLAVVATDAILDQAQATRMAVAAHDGIARAVLPAHTLLDGDIVFAVATGLRPLSDDGWEALRLGHAAAACVARAMARAAYEAEPSPAGLPPSWRELWG